MNWLTSRCAPLAAVAALALASCDKGTDLNVDLPDTTAISTQYQDYPVDVATVRIAPVQTLKADHFLVGRLADNVAGTTVARAYLNTIVGSSNDSLPSKTPSPVLDSVVMVMAFDKVNGSVTTPVQFNVSNLQAPLDERQAYNASSVTVPGTLLGQNLTSRLDRTVRVKTDSTLTTPAYYTNVADQTLRLALQRTAAATAPFAPAPAVASGFFGTTFFRALSTNTSFSQDQLDALLKGLAIEPSANYSSGIVNFARSGGYVGRLAFFFHDGTLAAPTPPTRRKWQSYSFYFGPVLSSAGLATAGDPRYYTSITNDLASTVLSPLADVTQAVPSTSPLLNGASYLQDGTGLGTRVTFKGLEQLRSTAGLTINRAELRVPVKPFSNALYSNPNFIYALEVDGSNQVLQRTVNFLPVDRVVQADGATQTGSTSPAFAVIDATTAQPYYSLLITSYLQSYLTNALDGNPAALVLVPNTRTSSTLSLSRAAIDASRLTLRVYYSKR